MNSPLPAQQTLDRIETLKAYLREDPTNLPLHHTLADLHLATNQPQDAAQVVESALQINPGDSAMRAALVSCLLAAGDIDGALGRSAEWLRVGRPELTQIRQLQGAFGGAVAAERFGDLLLILFDSSAEDDERRRLTLLQGLHLMGRTTDARTRAEAMLTRRFNPDAAALAALLAFDDGDWPHAQDLLRSAWSPSSSNVVLHYLHASFALVSGDTRTAETSASIALELSPADGRCWSVRGQVLLRQGRLAEAQSALLHALQLMPSHIGSHHLVAWTLLLQGDRPGARTHFEAALSLDRTFAESHGSLAVIAALDGQRASATAFLDRALRLDRRCASAQLAEVLLRMPAGASAAQVHAELQAAWDRLQRSPALAELLGTRSRR